MTVKDRGMILSTLWIFVTLNYLYCDVLSLMSPEMLNSLITTGGVGGMTMSEPTLLAAAILLEIPILLVLLSRVLKHKSNRLASIIGGLVMTLVMAGTLLMGEASLHYIFFAIIEIATTLFIVWFAWTWDEAESAESQAKNGAHTAA
ncbi:DUF6326 family protein [Microbulbifer rhizosphaerae]|uniref:Uncharacterized protein n=1 Tax=Microbulbifer rhizosphaerae TaxID=1562603 RepID=A0A7W4ZCT5_9GAMM|nr:DUF6326 family protein [Microbulbifer rhizosphaerae]MBB3063640.1 hypothetical protein [Microbulbifer rhizosphaerae]